MNDEKEFEPAQLESMYQQARVFAARGGHLVSRQQFAGAHIQFTVTINGYRKLLELGVELANCNALIPVRALKVAPESNGRG